MHFCNEHNNQEQLFRSIIQLLNIKALLPFSVLSIVDASLEVRRSLEVRGIASGLFFSEFFATLECLFDALPPSE